MIPIAVGTLTHALKNVSGFVGEEAQDLARSLRPGARPALAADQQAILRDLRRDGFAVVPNYWARDRALALRDELGALMARGEDADLPSGAALRFQRGREVDQGVTRIYHVDRERADLASLRHDPFILAIAGAYFGVPMHGSNLMFQHNTAAPGNTTRYFHVDCFTKELKAFVYLDDVELGLGPFTYIRGSQRWRGRRFWRFLRGNPNGLITSFSAQDIGEKRLAAEVPLTGAAGTMILTDVRGLHRGAPQTDGDRSVVVLYITKHPEIDLGG
jgi:hypothetical protein